MLGSSCTFGFLVCVVLRTVVCFSTTTTTTDYMIEDDYFSSLILKETPEAPTIVIGVAGSPVNLPCNITPPGDEDAEDAIALVLWYKDESTTPIYSLDARQGSLDQARHAAKDSLNARAHLSMAERPAYLKLDPVMLEDEGEYKCRADFKKARTRYMSVYLKVVVAPGKPVITDQNKEVLQSLIGPYNEGEPLVLLCDVVGGQPTPSVTWWRESVLLDDTYDVMSNGVIRNELLISSLQRHDLMGVFTCQASNNNVSVPSSASVTVDMNFRPLDVMIEGDRQPLSAHKTVELVCRATGSRPPAIITWWKGSSKLKALKDNISVDGNVTTSIITMTPSSDDNGKHLSCRAENPLISGSAIEYGWKLEVHYIPQLTLRLGSKLRHSHIQEGNDVYLDCSIVASPWVSDIAWKFNGKELNTNTSAGIIVSNQSLVLQKVQRTSRGHYTCGASNSEGDGESNVVQLRVQYSPVCKPGQKVMYGAAKHEEVKVVCEVEADPKQLSFRWEFNSSSDNLQVLTFVAEGLRSISTYIPRTEQDYGTLLCWAENSVGRQKDPCVYIVVPAGPPEPVQNCVINNQTEQSFRVECNEGYDGGMTQHFVLEVFDGTNIGLQTNQTSNEPNFVIKGLPPGMEFLVVVYAVNSKGKSESIAIRTTTLTTPESLTRVDDVWQVSFSPILVVLIAIVIGLVILALIVVLIVKIRPKHSNRKSNQDSRKDDKSHTPLRKDTDDDWKSCSCAGEEKCPDIIPAPLKEGTLDDDDDLCGDGLHWRTSSVDGGILTPDSYTRSKLTASGVPLLQNTPPTPPLSQELSLQPTLLQEYSPTKVISRAAKQALGDSHTDLITTTSRQTKV